MPFPATRPGWLRVPSTVSAVPGQPGASGAYPAAPKNSAHGPHDVACSHRPWTKTTGRPAAAIAHPFGHRAGCPSRDDQQPNETAKARLARGRRRERTRVSWAAAPPAVRELAARQRREPGRGRPDPLVGRGERHPDVALSRWAVELARGDQYAGPGQRADRAPAVVNRMGCP